MKILLDNCVSVRARALFAGHEVSHVVELGWDKLSNGRLIASATEAGYELLATVDKNLRHQQNIAALSITVLELDVVSNRLVDLMALSEAIPAAIEAGRTYRFVSVRVGGAMVVLGPRDCP